MEIVFLRPQRTKVLRCVTVRGNPAREIARALLFLRWKSIEALCHRIKVVYNCLLRQSGLNCALLRNMKENLDVTKVATQFPQVLTCANCIVANRLQRNTSQQFFVDKVHARSPWIAPIQSGSMIGQLAGTIETFSLKNSHVCISYYFPSRWDNISYFSTAKQLFGPSSSVHYPSCVSSISPEQVLCALMYEAKSTWKSPPSITPIAASNRKDRLYRLYRAYRVYRLSLPRKVD